MFIGLTIENNEDAPFQWKPGKFRSTIVTRYWWLWFAISFFHVDEYTFATTSYNWIGDARYRTNT